MQYSYDDDRNKYSGFGYTPPPAADKQNDIPFSQQDINNSVPADARSNVPVGAPLGTPGGAPADGAQDAMQDAANIKAPGSEFDAPASGSVPPQQRMFTFRGYYQQGGRPYTVSDENWREPSYSQTLKSVPNMYTPGICVDQPYSQRRAETPEPEPKIRVRSGFAGRFLRAVCLIIICVALSGVTAYGVTQGWFGLPSMQNGAGENAPPVVNQVVLGGTNPYNQRNDRPTPSVVASGAGIPAEDIYDMACSQVVGVRTEMPEAGGSGARGGMFAFPGSTVVSGSGFIISNDGYILTNYHVVETAYEYDLPLIVSLHDGTDFDAKVIGFESSNDIALVKIEATGLNAAVIANSDNIRVGEPVYAVGNPFGDLVYTMTEGIVSALDRIVTVEKKSISTFQFSAAVNSGNSGGPVYDAYGEVIGIVSAKIMGDSVEGIGFAIPINDAIEIASELIEHGYITGRPFFGITVQTVNVGLADYFGWAEGAYVVSVSPGSAAEKAGMKVGDIIIALEDNEIKSEEYLIYTLRKYKAGETIIVTVLRTGEKIELSVTFDENLAAGQPQRIQPEQPESPGIKPSVGIP